MFDQSGAVQDRPGAPSQEGASPGDVFHGIIARLTERVLDDLDELDRSLKAEAIHELRVDITTLRDALSALPAGLPHRRVNALRDHLKWLKGHMAPAREWNVFIDRHELFHDKLLVDKATQIVAADAHALYLKALGEVALALRERQSTALRQSLTVLCGKAAELPKAPDRRVRKAAAKVLDAKWLRVRQRTRHLDRMTLAALHRLRIEVRRLRHMCELLQPLFGDQRAGAYIDALTDLQSTLGAIQDGVSAQRLVSMLAEQSGDKVQAVCDAMQAKQKSRRKHLRRRLRGQWQEIRTLDRFWEAA